MHKFNNYIIHSIIFIFTGVLIVLFGGTGVSAQANVSIMGRVQIWAQDKIDDPLNNHLRYYSSAANIPTAPCPGPAIPPAPTGSKWPVYNKLRVYTSGQTQYLDQCPTSTSGPFYSMSVSSGRRTVEIKQADLPPGYMCGKWSVYNIKSDGTGDWKSGFGCKIDMDFPIIGGKSDNIYHVWFYIRPPNKIIGRVKDLTSGKLLGSTSAPAPCNNASTYILGSNMSVSDNGRVNPLTNCSNGPLYISKDYSDVPGQVVMRLNNLPADYVCSKWSYYAYNDAVNAPYYIEGPAKSITGGCEAVFNAQDRFKDSRFSSITRDSWSTTNHFWFYVTKKQTTIKTSAPTPSPVKPSVSPSSTPDTGTLACASSEYKAIEAKGVQFKVNDPSKEYKFAIPTQFSSSKIRIIGNKTEGHPELGCKAGVKNDNGKQYCDENQPNEEVLFQDGYNNSVEIFRVNDRNPDKSEYVNGVCPSGKTCFDDARYIFDSGNVSLKKNTSTNDYRVKIKHTNRTGVGFDGTTQGSVMVDFAVCAGTLSADSEGSAVSQIEPVDVFSAQGAYASEPDGGTADVVVSQPPNIVKPSKAGILERIMMYLVNLFR